VLAQGQKIDSLKNLLQKNQSEDTIHINILIDLAHIYRQVKPDTTLILAKQALSIAQETGYKTGEAWALNRLAGGYWMKAQYPASLKFTLKSLAIFEQLKNKKGIAECYNSLANTYNMEKDNQKSLHYYQAALGIYQEIEDYFLIARTYANIGRTYFMTQKYDNALQNLQKVLDMPPKKRESVTFAIALNTSGDVYQAQGKLEQALQNYFKALKITEELKIPRLITYSTRGISEIYQKQGNIPESNRFAERTLQIAKEIKYIENVKNAAFILSNNYKTNGNFQKALDYYLEFEVAKDSMFNADKEKEIRQLNESYALEEKENQIKLLKTEQEAQKAINQKQQILVYSLIIGLTLVGILAFILYRGSVIKQKVNRLLTLQRNRLTEQNAEIMQQREEILNQSEMLKKANDLKDKLFSIIAHDLRSPFNSLLMVTQYLDNQMFTPEELKKIKEKLYANITSLSEMLNNLLLWANQQMHGGVSEKKTIDLKNVIQKNLKIFEIPASEKNITLQNDAKADILAYGDADQIDSILRNLINNAIKFTKPEGSIIIDANPREMDVLVTIKDTGIGIPNEQLYKLFASDSKLTTLGTAKEVGSGLGLMLCKDFVEYNGGKIWVESAENIGTTFFFTLPLAKN
jgi:two-component system, sensor histidine kinase and response regulator